MKHVGPSTALALNQAGLTLKNSGVLTELQRLGLPVDEGTSQDTREELKGDDKSEELVFVITGTLQGLTRAEARTKLEHRGARLGQSSVSKPLYIFIIIFISIAIYIFVFVVKNELLMCRYGMC